MPNISRASFEFSLVSLSGTVFKGDNAPVSGDLKELDEGEMESNKTGIMTRNM